MPDDLEVLLAAARTDLDRDRVVGESVRLVWKVAALFGAIAGIALLCFGIAALIYFPRRNVA
ncbi:MAG: hypothetical protein QM714_06705 [Nocardioides sp.]|uniref:hypothetical protein n=1 Tax=Nocardioides sp. TaxID=35761 RepID=UPI0039E6E3CC